MDRLVRPLVLAIALSMVIAGCIGKEDVAPEAPAPEANETVEQNATLPDGRGESAGLLETNKTEEGVGGVEHLHDYWQNKEKIVLFDEAVSVGCPPCMPDGEGTQAKSVGYVKLGKLPEGEGDALVYEGADRVEILFGKPLVTEGGWSIGGQEVPVPEVEHAAPPRVFMQYRSAADSEWSSPTEMAPNTPTTIEVTPLMTDMPHSTHSLWVWRITTDRPDLEVQVPMTVTVYKGRNVVDWPGHPEFYAEKAERVVMQQHVTTHMSGLESFALYDSGGTWAHPDKLISWGTKELHVFMNITKVSNAYNADGTGFFLEAHNATVIGPEVTFGKRFFDKDEPEDLKSWDFVIKVNDEGMDGPYQPASRWGFRAMATFAEIPGVTGLCPGCFPYDIEYDITVIARNYTTDEEARDL